MDSIKAGVIISILRWLLRLVRWCFALLLIGLCCGYLFFRYHSHDVLSEYLTSYAGVPVSIKSISYHFPFCFRFHDVSVGSSFRAGQVDVPVSLRRLLRRKEIYVETILLVHPVITQSFSNPESANDGLLDVSSFFESQPLMANRLTVTIPKVEIQNGQIETVCVYRDKSVLVVLDHLFGDVQPFLSYEEVDIQPKTFRIKGTLRSLAGYPLDASVDALGWIDLKAKDMDLKVIIDRSQGQTLTIESQAQNNVVQNKAHLVMNQRFQTDSNDLTQWGAFGELLFYDNQPMDVGIQMDFSWTSKLNDWRVDEIVFEGGVLLGEDQNREEKEASTINN